MQEGSSQEGLTCAKALYLIIASGRRKSRGFPDHVTLQVWLTGSHSPLNWLFSQRLSLFCSDTDQWGVVAVAYPNVMGPQQSQPCSDGWSGARNQYRRYAPICLEKA